MRFTWVCLLLLFACTQTQTTDMLRNEVADLMAGDNRPTEIGITYELISEGLPPSTTALHKKAGKHRIDLNIGGLGDISSYSEDGNPSVVTCSTFFGKTSCSTEEYEDYDESSLTEALITAEIDINEEGSTLSRLEERNIAGIAAQCYSHTDAAGQITEFCYSAKGVQLHYKNSEMTQTATAYSTSVPDEKFIPPVTTDDS